MKNSDKAFVQAYNAQATVDVDSHIILAADITDSASDRKQLQPQMEQVKQNTGRKPMICSADAGYYSESNLEYLESEEIDALCFFTEGIYHLRKIIISGKLWTRRREIRYGERQISGFGTKAIIRSY